MCMNGWLEIIIILNRQRGYYPFGRVIFVQSKKKPGLKMKMMNRQSAYSSKSKYTFCVGIYKSKACVWIFLFLLLVLLFFSVSFIRFRFWCEQYLAKSGQRDEEACKRWGHRNTFRYIMPGERARQRQRETIYMRGTNWGVLIIASPIDDSRAWSQSIKKQTNASSDELAGPKNGFSLTPTFVGLFWN